MMGRDHSSSDCSLGPGFLLSAFDIDVFSWSKGGPTIVHSELLWERESLPTSLDS